MKYSIRQLKSMAWESLQGNYGTISALLLYMLINFLINFVSNLLFRNGSTLTAVVSFLFSFVISLIMCIFSAGLDYMYLNISRKQPVQVSDLFYMFNHNPDRVIAAGFVLTLLTTLADLPITLSLLYLPGLSEGSPTALLQFMGIVLISIVLSVLLCFPFSFAYFLLAESPDMGAGEALKQSAGLIRHNFLSVSSFWNAVFWDWLFYLYLLCTLHCSLSFPICVPVWSFCIGKQEASCMPVLTRRTTVRLSLRHPSTAILSKMITIQKPDFCI